MYFLNLETKKAPTAVASGLGREIKITYKSLRFTWSTTLTIATVKACLTSVHNDYRLVMAFIA